jgi:hypothetical protein
LRETDGRLKLRLGVSKQAAFKRIPHGWSTENSSLSLNDAKHEKFVLDRSQF